MASGTVPGTLHQFIPKTRGLRFPFPRPLHAIGADILLFQMALFAGISKKAPADQHVQSSMAYANSSSIADIFRCGESRLNAHFC